MVATAEEKVLGETLERWQGLEDEIVAITDEALGKAKSPLVRVIMEVIQHDSRLHHHVQGLLIESLESGKPIDVPEDELDGLWDLLERHADLERRAVEVAEASIDALGGQKRNIPHRYLVSYLLDDEKKHEKLLSSLALLKKQMYEA